MWDEIALECLGLKMFLNYSSSCLRGSIPEWFPDHGGHEIEIVRIQYKWRGTVPLCGKLFKKCPLSGRKLILLLQLFLFYLVKAIM